MGSGLFGCTFAREAADRGKKCLVIDGRPQLGGNVYCEDMDGITVHKYGTHIFHTDDNTIWDYVNRYAKFVPVEDGFVPIGGYTGLIEGLLKDIPAVTGVGYQHLMEVCPDIADKVIYTGGIGPSKRHFWWAAGKLQRLCDGRGNQSRNGFGGRGIESAVGIWIIRFLGQILTLICTLTTAGSANTT